MYWGPTVQTGSCLKTHCKKKVSSKWQELCERHSGFLEVVSPSKHDGQIDAKRVCGGLPAKSKNKSNGPACDKNSWGPVFKNQWESVGQLCYQCLRNKRRSGYKRLKDNILPHTPYFNVAVFDAASRRTKKKCLLPNHP